MQCRCRKIAIARQVVERITDYTMYEICRMLMNGKKLANVRKELELPQAVLEMFIDEIRRMLLGAGLEVRGF